MRLGGTSTGNHRTQGVLACQIIRGEHQLQLTQVDNLSLSKLLPEEEGNRPCQIEGKLQPIECQWPFLHLKTTLLPNQV